jgi:hypothetical protein
LSAIKLKYTTAKDQISIEGVINVVLKRLYGEK